MISALGHYRVAQTLLQISSYLPKGRTKVGRAICRLTSRNGVALSLYGPLLKSNPEDATFRLCAEGAYGYVFSDFLDRQRKPFSFVDVGANLGIYSLIAARNPQCRQCYAFEPNPAVFDVLVKNLGLNRCEERITARNIGISDKAGEHRFAVTATHSGGGAISASGDLTIRCENRAAFDMIADGDPLPKIVKIDVEGHEPAVIGQLVQSQMWPQVAVLFFEASDDRYDVSAVRQEVEGAGFRLAARNDQYGGIHDLLFVRSPTA
jgi:FkbM family methyltransferase